MSNFTIVFDKCLPSEEYKEVGFLTSAKEINLITDDEIAEPLADFCNIILGEECDGISVYELKDVLTLADLTRSNLVPVLGFPTDENTLGTFVKYGKTASSAQHIMRVLKVTRGTAMLIVEGKMELGLKVSDEALNFLTNDISLAFQDEFDDIVSKGRAYCDAVSVF